MGKAGYLRHDFDCCYSTDCECPTCGDHLWVEYKHHHDPKVWVVCLTCEDEGPRLPLHPGHLDADSAMALEAYCEERSHQQMTLFDG